MYMHKRVPWWCSLSSPVCCWVWSFSTTTKVTIILQNTGSKKSHTAQYDSLYNFILLDIQAGDGYPSNLCYVSRIWYWIWYVLFPFFFFFPSLRDLTVISKPWYVPPYWSVLWSGEQIMCICSPCILVIQLHQKECQSGEIMQIWL